MTLSDELRKSLANPFFGFVTISYKTVRQAADTIDALEKRIAELEARVAGLDEAVTLRDRALLYRMQRCAVLEAENAGIREALRREGYEVGFVDGEWILGV